MAITYFEVLNPEHQIFKKLISENPKWWQILKQDSEIYIDIRKDNYLNAYFNGGSILKIKLTKENEFEAETHYKYVEKNKILKSKSPYIKYDLEKINLDEIIRFKNSIKSCQSVESEKYTQGRLIVSSTSTYLDSEFAYNDYDNLIRIDLVKLKDNKFVFEELKRIQDNRLLTIEYENGEPEILSQIKKYNDFIKKNKEELTLYYKKIFKLKAALGILPLNIKDIKDIDTYTVSDRVLLNLEPYSDGKTTPRRIKRITALKEILNSNEIIHNL